MLCRWVSQTSNVIPSTIRNIKTLYIPISFFSEQSQSSQKQMHLEKIQASKAIYRTHILRHLGDNICKTWRQLMVRNLIGELDRIQSSFTLLKGQFPPNLKATTHTIQSKNSSIHVFTIHNLNEKEKKSCRGFLSSPWWSRARRGIEASEQVLGAWSWRFHSSIHERTPL